MFSMEKPAVSFFSIPAELRLRILGHTHLGPPSTGGYNESWECLRIREGRIVPRHHPLLDPPSESVWLVFPPLPSSPWAEACLR